MKRPIRAALLILGLLSILAIGSVWNRPNACHLMHLAFPPRDLFEPVLVKRGLLASPGQTYEFSFNPKYCDLYELGFREGLEPVPSAYRPSVRVEAKISLGDEVVANIDTKKPKRVAYAKSGEGIQKIAFGSFGLPSSRESAQITLHVSTPDGSADEILSSMEFYVAVSGSP